MFSMGYRRAKSTEGNTNFQKEFFDKQLRDHYPRALMLALMLQAGVEWASCMQWNTAGIDRKKVSHPMSTLDADLETKLYLNFQGGSLATVNPHQVSLPCVRAWISVNNPRVQLPWLSSSEGFLLSCPESVAVWRGAEEYNPVLHRNVQWRGPCTWKILSFSWHYCSCSCSWTRINAKP